VFNCYDYDPRQLKTYHDCAEDDAGFQQYLDKYVYRVKTYAEYLAAIGGSTRMDSLKANPAYGYRPDLKRRRLDG
jgi:hypothetical protein